MLCAVVFCYGGVLNSTGTVLSSIQHEQKCIGPYLRDPFSAKTLTVYIANARRIVYKLFYKSKTIDMFNLFNSPSDIVCDCAFENMLSAGGCL